MQFHAIDAATGKTVWTVTLGGAVLSSPVIDVNGVIYVGADDFKV